MRRVKFLVSLKPFPKLNDPGLFKPNSVAIRFFLSLVTSFRFYISYVILLEHFVPAAQKAMSG